MACLTRETILLCYFFVTLEYHGHMCYIARMQLWNLCQQKCIYTEIDGLDPQKREMLEARITGRVSCHNISDLVMSCGCVL